MAHLFAVLRRSLRGHADEREDHATAIPGEFGILPMSRGPPFSALVAAARLQIGLVRSATAVRGHVASRDRGNRPCSGCGGRSPDGPASSKPSTTTRITARSPGAFRRLAAVRGRPAWSCRIEPPRDQSMPGTEHWSVPDSRPCKTSTLRGDRTRVDHVHGPAPTDKTCVHARAQAPPQAQVTASVCVLFRISE